MLFREFLYISSGEFHSVAEPFFQFLCPLALVDKAVMESPAMSSRRINVAQMAKYEKALSGKEVHYLPKDKLEPDGLPWIKNGDIIALTTNTPESSSAICRVADVCSCKRSTVSV